MDRIKKCYVQPQMGDGGLCIGACALAFNQESSRIYGNELSIKKLTSMYLGPEASYRDSSPDEFAGEFCNQLITYAKATSALAESLKKNNVIGLINGRMEFGPRALCNRSIIVPTSDKTINHWLNKRMNRTEFMPFAPVLRKEIAPHCIKNFDEEDSTLNFMTSTVDCTDEFPTYNPAVVHIDKTARPQIVTEDSNNFIWNVLLKWEEISEEYSLVNTSFNVHEEPIICDIDEGIVSLRQDIIDQLWIVEKDQVRIFSKKSLQL